MSAATKVSETPIRAQKQTWKDVEFPSYYANIMGLGMTPFDITIVFGEVSEAKATEVISTPKVKVILSPEQASNLAQMLIAGIQGFVAQSGPIRPAGNLPPNALKLEKHEGK